MKPAIYYAVIRRGWTSQLGFAVGAVTSEKRSKVYFRYVKDNEASNCRKDEIKAKYISRGDAEAAISRVIAAGANNDEDIKLARSKLKEAEDRRQIALNNALKFGSVTDKQIEEELRNSK